MPHSLESESGNQREIMKLEIQTPEVKKVRSQFRSQIVRCGCRELGNQARSKKLRSLLHGQRVKKSWS